MERKLFFSNLMKIFSGYWVYLFSPLAIILASMSCVFCYTSEIALVISLIIYGVLLLGIYLGYTSVWCDDVKNVKDVLKYVGFYSFTLAVFHFLSYILTYQEEGVECHFWAYLVAIIVSGILIIFITTSIENYDNNIPALTVFLFLCTLTFLLPVSCATENDEIEKRQLNKEEFMTVQKYYTEVFNRNTVYIVVCKKGTLRISPNEYPEIRDIHEGTKIKVLLDPMNDGYGMKGYKRLDIKN